MAETPIAAQDDLRKALRLELRNRRRALTPAQQEHASAWVLHHLMKLPQFLRAHHVALYIANDGEIDPQAIAAQFWKMDKQVYLPVLRPNKRALWFVRYEATTLLTPNSLKIPEPDHQRNHKMPAHLLDLVLMPLVGFDRTGARLGMGGGFYDSTFAFKQQQPKGKPVLIGLAHSCQEVDALATANWDIPLFAVATEQGIITAPSIIG